MPFVPVPNTAMIECRMLMHGQNVENTLWFRNSTGVTATNLQDLTTSIADWWSSQYRTHISGAVRLIEIYGRDMTTATGPQAVSTLALGDTGAKAAAAAPANVSLAVSFRTALTGRNYRGRNYIAGLAEEEINDSTLNDQVARSFQAVYDNLLTTGTLPTGWTWVIASRYNGVAMDGTPIPRSQGEAHPVTSVTVVDYTTDSMRRRLPGRGK